MKKVLTILVVLALVCGAVFAVDTETHRVTLQTTIGEVLPVFQLVRAAYTGTATDGTAVTATAETTNTTGGINANGVTEDGIRFFDGADYELTELEVGDLSKYDVDVTFNVKVSNAAKSVRTFTLTFEAGDFSVSRNNKTDGANGKHAATTKEITAAGQLTGVKSSVSDTNDQIMLAVFNGTTLVPGQTGTVLGTYHVVYPADSTIDPSVGNSTTATYTADITLTITT